jgi:hypothetical protein
MESRFGERLMMAIMVIGFLMSAAYALSSSHHHKDDSAAPAKAEATQSSGSS